MKCNKKRRKKSRRKKYEVSNNFDLVNDSWCHSEASVCVAFKYGHTSESSWDSWRTPLKQNLRQLSHTALSFEKAMRADEVRIFILQELRST